MEESTTSTQAKLKLLEEECKLHNIDLQKWAVDSYQHEVKDLTGEEIASMLLWIKKSFGDKS